MKIKPSVLALTALLTLLIIKAFNASAGTIITDADGKPIGTFPWPFDRTVFCVIPTSTKLIPLSPPATPAPVIIQYRLGGSSTPKPL